MTMTLEKVFACKCPYCDKLFPDEDAGFKHIKAEHSGTDTMTFYRYKLKYSHEPGGQTEVHIDACHGTKESADSLVLKEPVVEWYGTRIEVVFYDYQNTRLHLDTQIRERGRIALRHYYDNKADSMASNSMRVDAQSDWPKEEEPANGKHV